MRTIKFKQLLNTTNLIRFIVFYEILKYSLNDRV